MVSSYSKHHNEAVLNRTSQYRSDKIYSRKKNTFKLSGKHLIVVQLLLSVLALGQHHPAVNRNKTDTADNTSDSRGPE